MQQQPATDAAEPPEGDQPPTDPATPPHGEQPPEPPDGEQPPEPVEVMPGATPDALRAEVRRLRDEAAEQRTKGKRADDLAERLVTAIAAGGRRLADPTDLTYSGDLLDGDGIPDPAKVDAAVDALLAAKPHLASRTPRGDVSQGPQGDDPAPGLLDLMRG